MDKGEYIYQLVCGVLLVASLIGIAIYFLIYK
jgi:hypothetical protein